MSHQIGTLHRSISYTANLHSSHVLLFPPFPDSPNTDNSSSMDSDSNSTTTVYNTISQYNNFPILKHPTNLPTQNQARPPSLSPSSHTYVTPIYSPLTNDPPDNNSPVDTEIENELDKFITLQQQQLQPPQTLTLSSTLTIHHIFRLLKPHIIHWNPSP